MSGGDSGQTTSGTFEKTCGNLEVKVHGGMQMTEQKQKVAVIGAKGIGRHHAKWWHTEGVEVCAFAGTSSILLFSKNGSGQPYDN